MWSSVFVYFHLARFQDSFILYHVSGFHSFPQPNNILLCKYTTSYLPSYHLVAICVVSIFWLFAVLLWTFKYKFLFGHLFLIIWGTCLGVELLGHMVILCLACCRLYTVFLTYIIIFILPSMYYNPHVQMRLKDIKWIAKQCLDLPLYSKHFIKSQSQPKWDRFITGYIFHLP